MELALVLIPVVEDTQAMETIHEEIENVYTANC